MRYDAYRLPGVKWRWVGLGKSPEPDCWPEHVVIEGVKVQVVRGKGWGWTRAFYRCPVCGKLAKSLYSAPHHRQSDASAVRCRAHFPAHVISRQDAVVAARRAREMRAKYRNPERLAAADRLERQARDNGRIVV